jgi:hypothetical protein
LPHAVDWSLYTVIQEEHGLTTAPGLTPIFAELSDEAGTLGSGDNRVVLYRGASALEHTAEWQTATQGAVSRTFTATAAQQTLILRHRSSDHALQLELNGSASAYGTAPTSHGSAGGVHRTLRVGNNGFCHLRALILARGSHTAAEFAEWLP